MFSIPREILVSRDWSRLSEYIAKNAVIIVTGTCEYAEVFDRPLAYTVVEALASRGFFPVVMSDGFILNIGKRLPRLLEEKTPFITIGGRVANAFTAFVIREIAVDPEEYVGIVEWRGTVVGMAYGRDPLGTRDAVNKFISMYLNEFTKKILGRKGVSLSPWPVEAYDRVSLTQMLAELANVKDEKTSGKEEVSSNDCNEPVKVVDPTSGQVVELVPIAVWKLVPPDKHGMKMGVFKSLVTGKYFRARVPDDYPECGYPIESLSPTESKRLPLDVKELRHFIKRGLVLQPKS